MVIYSETHSNKTLEKLNFQRISSEFTDINVSIEGRHFSLHKSLLAAHSSLFCSVLQDVTIGQAPNINLDGVELEYFSMIIDFIYTSKLDITSENMDNLHTTAQFLQIQDVIELCNQFKKQEKEALARQLADQNKKVECYIKKQIPSRNSLPTQQQEAKPQQKNATDENVGSGEKNTETQQNQVSSMMVEVYGSKDSSFATEDTKLSSASPESRDHEILSEEADEGSKVRKRGRKPLERVICQICNKSFTRPKYEVHKRIHTGEKPFTCKTCNKQFVTIYNLRIHERIHTGERPYHCKLCNKTFADPSTIRKHVLWHAGVKNKQCDLCGKYFATMTQVREHRRSHTKEKPYVCPECGKAYGYRCDLKRHMREHTGDLIGPCEECGKYFNHKGNFLSHIKSHAKKATSPQLKLQDSGLVTPDGRMILKAKFCDGMLVLPSQGTTSNNDGDDVTMQEAITHRPDQSGSSQPQNRKLSPSVEDEEIELTINDRKFFVKHADGDRPQIILKDEGLSTASPSEDQGQIFEQECETALSADQVIMLVQHAQGLDIRPGSIAMVKGESSKNEEIILSNDDETLVVVDGNAM